MKSERKRKLEKTMRKIVSDFITVNLPDDDKIFGIINITDVILSPDSSYLDIHVNSFIQQELLTKTLAKHAHIIQRQLWKQMWIRVNPRVRFRYDGSWELGQEMIQKINNLNI